VHLLVNIVSKGGNLLLGVGPNGDGNFEPRVHENLTKLGNWLAANGEAIYDTHPVEPFLDGKVAYTAKGRNTVYAIYLTEKDEYELPSEIFVQTDLPGNLKISLPASKQKLKIKRIGNGIKISIPESLRNSLAEQEAVVFKLTSE